MKAAPGPNGEEYYYYYYYYDDEEGEQNVSAFFGIQLHLYEKTNVSKNISHIDIYLQGLDSAPGS